MSDAAETAAVALSLAAVFAAFAFFLFCFCAFLCAKRHGGAGHAIRRAGARLAAVAIEPGGGGSGVWACRDYGLDDATIAELPATTVHEPRPDCTVCLSELATGETARVLPRCGHGFHVECVDAWLRLHATCPLCRCPAVDPPPASCNHHRPIQAPEADPESPNFPTNVLFWGTQDDVTTGGGSAAQALPSPSVRDGSTAAAVAAVETPSPRMLTLRRFLGRGSPQRPSSSGGDVELGLSLAGVDDSLPQAAS